MIVDRKSASGIIVILLIAVSTLVLSVFGYVDYLRIGHDLEERLDKDLHLLGNQLAVSLASPLRNNEYEDVRKICTSVMQNEVVVCVIVKKLSPETEILLLGRDEKGEVAERSEPVSTLERLRIRKDIYDGERAIGLVELRLTNDFMNAALAFTANTKIIDVLSLNISLVLMIFMVLNKLVLSPMKTMVGYTRAVSAGQDGEAIIRGRFFRGEFEELKNAMAAMVGELKLRYSELKKSQDDLAEAELRYRSIFVNLGMGIFQLDEEGRLITANPSLASFLGYDSPLELISEKRCFISRHGFNSRQASALLERIRERKNVSDWEMEFLREDGRRVWGLVSATPVFNEGSQFLYCVGLLEDVTMRKLAEHKVRKSMELLEQIIDNSPSMIFLKDAGSRYIMVNRQYEMFLNMSKKDIIGKTSYDILDAPIADEIAVEDLKAMETGDVVVSEKEFDTSGGVRHLLVSRFPILDEDYKPKCVCGIAVDITELKRIQDSLTKTRKYLDNIINSMPSVLVGVDAQGVITHWNAQASKETGINLEDACGRYLSEVLPSLSRQMHKICESIATRTPVVMEKHPERHEDMTHYHDILIYPLIANGVEGAVIRIDDVTNRVKIEEMMVQTEKMTSIGGLAAGMAHEINNPLSAILQGVQNILRRISDDIPKNTITAEECCTSLDAIREYLSRRDIIKFLQGIRSSGERAALIVANMLDFSRPSESRSAPQNISELIDRTIDLAASDFDLKKQYDFRRIEIIREYAAENDVVRCTKTEIEQVVLNLLKNAAQAMSDKEYSAQDRPFIRIRTYNEEAWFCVEIEDNGPGMSESVRRRIFEPFFTTKPLGKGTGLGLSVSYFIIAGNHKGNIHVESEEGKGTKFIIRLPCRSR